MLDFLIKSSTDKAEKNFAVMFVFSTWFGPAKYSLKGSDEYSPI